ncbi:MAG: LysM peptidoglycan-binding domain-containing protein [Actinomycetota bacterium]|nr:LysM peptidoglycan-binding domain-containing protein [Actinomycetota bacterium]
MAAGDSLWTIAGRVLDTDDPRRIARYWPRIHRANRSLIRTTPNLIRPGWVLELPPECD